MKSKNWKKIAALLLVACMVPTACFAYGQVVTGSITFVGSFGLVDNSGIQPNTLAESISATQQYSNGTASNQVDTIYAAKLTFVASTPQTIDLTTLVDPAGNSINFSGGRVREFIVQNTSTTAGFDVKVLAGSANGWSVLSPAANPVYCRYGGTLRISDPVSTGGGNGNVVSGSSKTVTFDPGSNAATLTILIVGGSSAFLFLILPMPVLRRARRAFRRAA